LLARARKSALSAFRDEALKEMERDKLELMENFERMKRAVDELEIREAALSREIIARTHLQASLTKVLDSVSNAAFLVRADSIEGANDAGTAALAREGDRLHGEVLDVARKGSANGFDVTRTGATGEVLVIRKGLGDEVSRRLERATAHWALTPRQSDVLRGLVDGLSNGEIAERLGCTPRTVEVHVTALLDRADATSRLQLVAAFWGDLPAK
jgi:DNA-binding CsgD family transcriptional regulator